MRLGAPPRFSSAQVLDYEYSWRRVCARAVLHYTLCHLSLSPCCASSAQRSPLSQLTECRAGSLSLSMPRLIPRTAVYNVAVDVACAPRRASINMQRGAESSAYLLQLEIAGRRKARPPLD